MNAAHCEVSLSYNMYMHGVRCNPFTNYYRKVSWGTIFVHAMVTVNEGIILRSQYDIKISEMKIDIIPVEGKEGLWQIDNMDT